MVIQLTNLSTHVPNDEDSYAIAELVAVCEIAEFGNAGRTMDDLRRSWSRSNFHLSEDAWVIVTRKGQVAAFGCVWHRDYEEFSSFVCVHPDYRQRGIGTLLLRLIEKRARHQVSREHPEVRVRNTTVPHACTRSRISRGHGVHNDAQNADTMRTRARPHRLIFASL